MTLREMFPFVRFRIGGLVVSRSVKYLGKLVFWPSTASYTSILWLAS